MLVYLHKVINDCTAFFPYNRENLAMNFLCTTLVTVIEDDATGLQILNQLSDLGLASAA